MHWFRILENSSARLYGAAVSFVILFVTARLLGPDGRGILVAAITWVALFAALAGLSLGQIIHSRVQKRQHAEWLPELAGTMFVSAAIMAGFAYGAIVLILLLWGEGLFRGVPARVILLAGLSIPLLILDDYGRNILMAASNVRRYVVAQFVGHSVGLVSVLVTCGLLGLGVSGVVIGLIAGQAAVVAMELRAIWRLSGHTLRPSKQEAKALIHGALQLHPNTVASFLLAQANILLLNQFASNAEVGWYQLAYQFVTILMLIPQGAGMILYSRIAQLGPNEAWPQQRRIMLEVIGVMAALSLLAYLLAPTIIHAFAGPDFDPAVGIFRWLLPILLGLSLAEMMAPQWFSRGIFLPTTILTCVTAVVSIVINSVLIQMYGVMGAVWGTVIIYFGLTGITQLVFAAWCQLKHRVGVTSPADKVRP